ncbi:hypothetical protein AJ79_03151 [Helicocarpus griseus UAMH5409]|uniref:Uncharacterized protein n=1 Tax=Helicocarpus griseus UAMH5409 TaxID=1447875 RepID=A0A2B7XZI5_9EURO|nr:hypothetical protein AJ79_03151 [Helicocarpus griseus UAMH5409]
MSNEDYKEYIEEVTDDKGSDVEGTSTSATPAPMHNKQSSGVRSAAAETPGAKSPAPGKVSSSPQVKNMKHSSPEASANKKAISGLNPQKNPFEVGGNWTKEQMSEITILSGNAGGKI